LAVAHARRTTINENAAEYLLGRIKSGHADVVRKLVSAGVSWKVIQLNGLDDPRLAGPEREEMVWAAIQGASARKQGRR